ncbi:probable ribonuclease P protein subunit p29 at C-terminar half [Coccomyxa sp. Obi]|nr:probable ribonuclease P protein subunit p29 at C-terminar half [Coccomyxa sp. Obi]
MADLSDAKKRRLAVLDSKLSGIQKKRKDRPSHHEAKDKAEAALQSQKTSDTSKKVPKAAQCGPSIIPSQSRQVEKDRAAPGIIPGSSAPPYDSISADANRGRLLAGTKLVPKAGASDYVDSFLEDLAGSNPRMPPSRAAAVLKVQDKTLLLDNPAAPVKKHELGRRSNQLTVLSGVQLKKLGLHQLPREDCRYDKLRSLNQRWESYAREALVNSANPEEAALQLDLHGCLLAVKQHQNPQLTGKEGIVVRYSKHAFHIVSMEDRLHVVPRSRDCNFEFRVDRLLVVFKK